jgi:hypothetical protein
MDPEESMYKITILKSLLHPEIVIPFETLEELESSELFRGVYEMLRIIDFMCPYEQMFKEELVRRWSGILSENK